MNRYQVIFFDLDHTLWDFDRNSEETLQELYAQHRLSERGVPDEFVFIETYRLYNKMLWNDYHLGKVSKEQLRIMRFAHTFDTFGFRDLQLESKFADQYLERSPYKKHLIPGAEMVLTQLSSDRSLHIITNGFREVQRIKIDTSGLSKYFDHIHISEEVGSMKPDPAIFHHAVGKSGREPAACVMIGDNFDTDILGAERAGIDAIFYNPSGTDFPEYKGNRVRKLEELLHLL
jgi:putative hydrolase of the HAD superfamily